MKTVSQLRSEWKKLETLADLFRFGAVAILLVSAIVFTALDKDILRAIVWYWAFGVGAIATIGFILGIFEGRAMNKYFAASTKQTEDFIGEDK